MILRSFSARFKAHPARVRQHLEEVPDWLALLAKVSAEMDGTFSETNARNNFTKTCAAREWA
jgi:hypothetical protein